MSKRKDTWLNATRDLQLRHQDLLKNLDPETRRGFSRYMTAREANGNVGSYQEFLLGDEHPEQIDYFRIQDAYERLQKYLSWPRTKRTQITQTLEIRAGFPVKPTMRHRPAQRLTSK